MTTFAANAYPGQTGEAGFGKLLRPVVATAGFLSATDFLVTAQSSPNNTVSVAVGDAVLGNSSPGASSYFMPVWNTAPVSVTLPANVSGVTKYDTIVMYLNRSALSTAVLHSADAVQFAAVRAAATDGSPATNSEIVSAIGNGNPYLVLAVVTLANNFSSVISGNIADKRTRVSLLPDASVGPEKRAGGFKVDAIAAATLGTTGNKPITGLGFCPKLVRFTAQRPSDTGAAYNAIGSMDLEGRQFASTSFAASNVFASRSSSAACLVVANNATNNALVMSYVSMDADGFTFNVTTASNNYVVFWEAYA